MYEKLFAGQITQAYKYYSQMHGDIILFYYLNALFENDKGQIYRNVK